METVWMCVSYPGEFTFGTDGCWSWGYDGGNDKGKSFPFLVPKKLTFVELYDKLVEKLQIDSNIYKMVLRCNNPSTSKNPPFEIGDDDTVDWLMSCQLPDIYITMKLKENVVGGSNTTMMPVHNGQKDINNDALALKDCMAIIDRLES